MPLRLARHFCVGRTHITRVSALSRIIPDDHPDCYGQNQTDNSCDKGDDAPAESLTCQVQRYTREHSAGHSGDKQQSSGQGETLRGQPMRGKFQRTDKPYCDKGADQEAPDTRPEKRRRQGENHRAKGAEHKTRCQQTARPVSIREESRRDLHRNIRVEVQRRQAAQGGGAQPEVQAEFPVQHSRCHPMEKP